MKVNNISILIMGLLAGCAVTTPLVEPFTKRQASVKGQACTDGTFDGTCRADGRCTLEIPPNESSSQFISGQCEAAGGDSDSATSNDNATSTGNNQGKATGNNNSAAGGSSASVEGDACTDGTFDGTCQANGRCGLNIPPNEFSQEFISGQCGQ
ncbi:hypothetical protein F5B20DRAFT_523402 [Whalleya microplaca]|nr:hypothetical protein F5B20DRAFT_523402 [Whalleya microplaca]